MKANSYLVHTVAIALGVAVLSAGAATAGEKKGTPSARAQERRASTSSIMNRNVPDSVKIRELRKMWRSTPMFNQTDGLVDYGGEDLTKTFRKTS